MSLSSVPVFLSVSGLYDVEYRIIVACRNGQIYTLKRGTKIVGRPTAELTSQPVGLLRRDRSIIVATMDQNLHSFNNKVSFKKFVLAYVHFQLTQIVYRLYNDVLNLRTKQN